MGRYILRRLLQAIPVLLGITLVSFLIVHLVPGGPAQAMLGPRATPLRIEEINRTLGLDKPLPVQYVIWLGHLLRGDFGTSYFYNQPVLTLILVNTPRTLAVVGLGTIASLLLSPIGAWQAYRRGSVGDHLITVLSYFFYSMPFFWLGIIMILIFGVWLPWFPSGGITSAVGGGPATFLDWASHLVLPVATIAIGTVAGWSRYVRSSMIDTLSLDFIRTGRAKGLSETAVVLKHALRNSLLPLITLLGFSIPSLFSGALFIEVVFNYPGLGLLFWDATVQRDYPVVLGGVVVVGVLTILGNLMADVLYAVADPRIRFD